MTSQNRRLTMKDNQAKYPQLRFKGFTDPWEQRKLGELGSTFTGLTGKTKEDFGHGDAKFVTYMNVFQNAVASLEQLDSVEIDSKQNEVKKGDVFFTTSSETPEEVGMSSVWKYNYDNVYLNSFTFGYRPNIEFDLDYLAAMLRSTTVRKKITFLAQGISRYNISKTKMMDIEVPVPSLEEQAKIGAFLSNVEQTITLHQRKLAKLKKLKQGYLQKLFPKNGSKFPQLRFAGFADAWKQRKLGGIMDVTSVKRIHQSDWTNKGVRFFRARDIVALSKREKIQDPLFISEQKYNEYSKSSGKVHVDDLLVTGVGSIGIPYLVKSTNPLYFKDGNIIWFKNNGYLDGSFLYYSFIGNSIQNYIKKTSGSGTVGTFTIMSGKKTPILIPKSYKEQQKIGSFFKSLDDTITLHQRKLEKLQELKKGYLQKMFC